MERVCHDVAKKSATAKNAWIHCEIRRHIAVGRRRVAVSVAKHTVSKITLHEPTS